MFDRSNLIIVAVAIVGAALGMAAGSWFRQPAASADPPGVAVLHKGDIRADLPYADLEGKPHRLGEYDGRVVLVNFWATWCGPCRDEMPLLDRTAQAWAGKGLQVVGVAIDDLDAVRSYLKESPVAYPILLDVTNESDTSVIFGDTRRVLPFSVLIDRSGRVVEQKAGAFSQASLTAWIEPHL